MKNIKKILIILFLIIIISGCRVSYEVKVNEDLSVNEKVTASENTDRMKSRTNLDINQSVSYLYKIYKTENMADDKFSIISADSTTSATVNNSYKDIKEYSDNFKTDIFKENIDCEKNNHIKLEFNQSGLIDSKASNRYVYDQIDVTFEIPFEVINHNADSVHGNKYSWIIRADEAEYKKILIEFNGEKPKNTATIKFGDQMFHIGYEYLFIVGAVIVVGILIVVIYVKNKKNNMM